MDRQFIEDSLAAQLAIRAAVFRDLSTDSGGLSAKLQQGERAQEVAWVVSERVQLKTNIVVAEAMAGYVMMEPPVSPQYIDSYIRIGAQSG